jgi:2-polyprenyl-3-methyl-5-hydroxy-6-metoxy-1,4-benzoquinol methylase
LKQVRVAELMDDPGLDPARHAHALEGLARLNKASFGAKHLWDEIVRVAKTNSTDKLRFLEIASGGGDVLLELAKRAEKAGLKLEITGSDLSPTAVALAQQKFSKINPKVNFIAMDALNDNFPASFDIVSTSLFTHHLDSDQLALLLRKMYGAATRCVIISDLERSRLNLALVWMATRVLTQSEVVHYDGPVSVRAAYTASEFLQLAADAGLKNASIKRVFPCRFMFTAQRHVD